MLSKCVGIGLRELMQIDKSKNLYVLIWKSRKNKRERQREREREGGRERGEYRDIEIERE